MNDRLHLAIASAFAVLWMFCLAVVRPIVSLPDISALDQVISGEAVVPVLDLSGQLIYEYNSPTYGEQTKVSLDEISDELIALTITTEDSRFFTNPGFSPAAILRAFAQNLMMRETFSGASTITQQVVRNILLSPKERFNRSVFRKMKEIFLAAAITARYDKETILGIYLNEIYYGRDATGVEKAAEIYFGKHAADLDILESAFIAGLPQAPNYYGNQTDAGRNRQYFVLQLMERAIREEPCIPIRSGKEPRSYCPDPKEIQEILSRPAEN